MILDKIQTLHEVDQDSEVKLPMVAAFGAAVNNACHMLLSCQGRVISFSSTQSKDLGYGSWRPNEVDLLKQIDHHFSAGSGEVTEKLHVFNRYLIKGASKGSSRKRRWQGEIQRCN